MSVNPNEPYQSLPPLPPEVNLETPRIFKSTIAASRALAKLDGACRRLPDPTMLINLIPVLEAQASSEIENIVTTNDELFRAVSGITDNLTPQTKEALRYREALHAGYQSLEHRPITTTTAKDICSIITGRPARIRDHAGTYTGNPTTKERVYTPPEGETVILDHLAKWEQFIHTNSHIDPLILMALAHYQFEAIHPFFDGNGRTGRILNILVLIEKQLIELPILYLSGYIVRHKETYYDLLNAVTVRGVWDDWILFMLAGVESTANWTLTIVETTDELRNNAAQIIRSAEPRLPAEALAKLMFSQPYLRIDTVTEAGLAKRQTASRWLNRISELGLLTRQLIGRHVLFVNTELINSLANTEFPANRLTQETPTETTR